ncbi:MAG: hypothetical protein ACI9FG_001753 [Crocinitomicaceae bacterium]|jgi:hypothetical protein
MSVHVKYGPIVITLEKDSEGSAFSCPLCHSMFFSTGAQVDSSKVVQDHMQQYHRIILPAATIIEDNIEPPKIQLKKVV